MKKNDLKKFMNKIVSELEKEKRYSSAHVYQSTRNAYCRFIETKRLENEHLNARLLKGFEDYLTERQLSLNTISTYMRMLRAAYNRAVERGMAKYIPALFRGVYTGAQSKIKRALPPQLMAKLMEEETLNAFPEGKWFVLMFMFRGMPFIDLAHLRKCDLHGDIITYHRHKTKKVLNITVPKEAMNIIRTSSSSKSSPYLFPILKENIDNGKEAYKNYQSELRKFNYRLGVIGKELGNGIKLSSYAARHTWATTAYHQRMPVGIISSALGHSSIKVTEFYLKPFDNNELNKANREIISYIKASTESAVTL